MDIGAFLRKATQSFFDPTPAPRPAAPPPPAPVDVPVAKVQQGRITNQDDLERHEPMEAPLISERLSYVDLRMFLRLYANHVWTYRCASVISTACASVKFNWMQGNKPVPDNKLQGFYIKPNAYMTWYGLIELAFLHLELAGNAFWEVQRDKDGKLLAIYPLRPDRIRIIPDAKKRIKRYEYWIPGAADYIKYEPQEILHLKYTDAMSEYYGVPPAAAAQNDTIQDLYMTAWNKEFFIKGAEPGVILSTPGTLTEIAYNRLARLWNRRHRGKPHEVAILEEGLTCTPMGSKHTDMQYLQGKEQQRDVIIAAYGVPPVLVGVIGRTGSSISDEKKVFWQHNIIPKIHRLETFLNDFLLTTGWSIGFVTKTLAVIIEDEKIKADLAQSNVTHGIWTQNEARRIEWDMDPVAWGDTWWAPVGVFDVTKPETRPGATPPPGGGAQPGVKNPNENLPNPMAQTAAKSPLGTPDRAQPGDPSQVRSQPLPVGRPKTKSDEPTGGWIDKRDLTEPDWTNRLQVRDYTDYLLWKQQAGPDERNLYGKFRQLFKEQGERVAARVAPHWPKRHIKKDATDGQDNQDNSDQVEPIISMVFDVQQENHNVRALILPEAQAILKKYGTTLLTSLGVNKQFNLANPRIQKFLEDYAGINITRINDTTRELIKNALSESYANNEDIKDVLGRLADIFGGDLSVDRAQNIARTELVSLTNTGRYEAAVESGVVKYKRWISEQLPTTRENPKGENHILMHGQVKALDEPFEAPARQGRIDLMNSPGDLKASAENCCRCVCIASYYSGTQEFSDILLPDGPPTSEE